MTDISSVKFRRQNWQLLNLDTLSECRYTSIRSDVVIKKNSMVESTNLIKLSLNFEVVTLFVPVHKQ